MFLIRHKGMQYFQKHAFWDITRQNRSSGLTPSCADEQIKTAQTINISPLRGGHPLNRSTCHFNHLGVLSGVPDVITHAKFCFNRLRGFSVAVPPKVPFRIVFRTTLTTVLHYRAELWQRNITDPMPLPWTTPFRRWAMSDEDHGTSWSTFYETCIWWKVFNTF